MQERLIEFMWAVESNRNATYPNIMFVLILMPTSTLDHEWRSAAAIEYDYIW